MKTSIKILCGSMAVLAVLIVGMAYSVEESGVKPDAVQEPVNLVELGSINPYLCNFFETG